ncbi:MAG: 4'-phosphopantetheinyl transferase family protein [Prochlorothrix sp.]|nr:4'-phosphopantetheinyl transferase superfamily protein [Prochlorothrix sp.]
MKISIGEPVEIRIAPTTTRGDTLQIPAPPQVDLWWADLDQAPSLDRLKVVLTATEQHRTDRYRTAQLQHRFAACRAQLRVILSGYLGWDPAAIEFDYGPQGKPHLQFKTQQSENGEAVRDWLDSEHPDSEHPGYEHPNGDDNPALEFNVSHCQGRALYGIARVPLGVDVEQVRSIAQPLTLARRFFAPEEVATLAALPPSQQHRQFLRHWVGKEALVKAWGSGIAQSLDRVVVAVNPSLRILALPSGVGQWSLLELQPPGGDASPASGPQSWIAALATPAAVTQVCWRSASWDFFAENQEPRYNS